MTDTAMRRNKPYAARMAPSERREQLLDSVLEIITTDGVGAVSVDGVARRAGVSRPVVYSLFIDTNDILRVSLDREEHRALTQLAGALPLDQDDVAASLIQLVETFLCAIAQAPQRWQAIYLISDSGTPAFHKRVHRARTTVIGQLKQAFRASDTFDATTDPDLLARYVVAALWDSGRLLLTEPDDYPHNRLLHALRQLITTLIPLPIG